MKRLVKDIVHALLVAVLVWLFFMAGCYILGSVDALNIRVSELETRIESLESEALNIDDKYTGLQSRISEIDNDLLELFTKQENVTEPPTANLHIPKKENIESEIAMRPGMIGRFIVPSADIDVAVFDSMSQSVCDAEDSAAMFSYGSAALVADHNDQDFATLKDCDVECYAYLVTADGTQTYICTDVFTGHNTGDELTDEDYNDITYDNPGGLICYTCMENWAHVWIVFFATL